jgi:antitoxin (DNA-binding transcriptional repressor) of toxin-antitoxin stability system
VENAREVTVSELRLSLAAVLERVDKGERFTVTRDGELWAVLLPTNEALWCEALAARFRGHLPPFTPEALDAWIADVMARADLSGLMEPVPTRNEPV